MAASAAAALLDELMGRDRNVAPGERKREIRWEDPEVCKHFLCGFCPTELFTNTRADLGVCDKLHDEALKKSYEKSSRFGRMSYEEEFVRHLQSLLADVERRIKRGHARLALNNTQGMLNQQPVGNASQEQIEILTSRINELVEEAEQLGCEGKVEEAQGVMKLCEQLREEREQLTANRRGALDEENIKRMEVCQVCGALLVSGDAQQRIDEHMSGKQHVGYARIRDYIETHKKDDRKSVKTTTPEPEDREAQLAAEREEREKLREKEREERKKLEEKEREKSRERDERRRRRRSQSRSRHRSRSRERSRRSRSRERKKSRDRDRERRSRHKSRSRSKSRRSSRERSRRSRSRDRKSRRHRDEDGNRKSAERNGEGHGDSREEEKPINPPEPPSEPPVDDPEYTAGDTN